VRYPAVAVCGNSVGVDLGLRFCRAVYWEKVSHPKWLQQSEKRLSRLREIVQDSKARKTVLRLAAGCKVVREGSNQRKDFLHKLSHRLINENQVVSLEGLRVSNMVRNRCLSKSISDSGWGEFARQIHYKAEWYGRTVKVLDTFCPSSKTCSICGFIKEDLTLVQRLWTCPNCRTIHDRDFNAAVNIAIIGRDTPEVTPAERRAAAVSILSMKQVRSAKQETPVSQ
jgi:putative transposase